MAKQDKVVLSDDDLEKIYKKALEQDKMSPIDYFNAQVSQRVGNRVLTPEEYDYRRKLGTRTVFVEDKGEGEDDGGFNPLSPLRALYSIPQKVFQASSGLGGMVVREKMDDLLTLATAIDKIKAGSMNPDTDKGFSRIRNEFRDKYNTGASFGLFDPSLVGLMPTSNPFAKDAVEDNNRNMKRVAQNILDAATGKQPEGGGGSLVSLAQIAAPDAEWTKSKFFTVPTTVVGDIVSDPLTYVGGSGIGAKAAKYAGKIPGAVRAGKAIKTAGTAEDAGKIAKVAGKAGRAVISPRTAENAILSNIASVGNLDLGLGMTLALGGARSLRNKYGAAAKLDDFIGKLYGFSRPRGGIPGLTDAQRTQSPPTLPLELEAPLRELMPGPGPARPMGPVVPPRALMPGPGPARPMGPAPTPTQQLGQALGELFSGPTRAPGRAIAQQRSDMPGSMEEILLGVAMRNPEVANKLGVALADPELAARLGVAATQKAKRTRKPRTKKPKPEEPAPEPLLEEITPESLVEEITPNPVEEVILPTARVEEALPAVPEPTKATALGKLPKALKVADPELQAITDEAWTRARATTKARLKNFDIEEADVPRVVQEEFAKTRSDLINSLARARQDLTLEDMILADPNDLSNIQVRNDLGEGWEFTSLEELQEIAARQAEEKVLDDFSNVNPDDVDYGFEIPDTREDFTNLVAETLSPGARRAPTQRPIFKYPETPAPYDMDPYELYNRVLGQEGRVPAITQPNLGQIQVARTGEPVELTGDYLRRLPEQPNVYRISEEDALYLQGMPTEQLMRLVDEIPENASLKNLNLRDAGKIELIQRGARYFSDLRKQGKNPTVPGMELTPGWKDWVEKHKTPGQLNAVRGAVPYVGTERVTGNIPGWQARKKYPEIFPSIKGDRPTRVNSKGEVEWIDDARVIRRARNPEEYDAYLKDLADRTVKRPSGASTTALEEEELPDFYRTGAELTEGQGYSKAMKQLTGGEASDVGRTIDPDAEEVDDVDKLTGELLDSYFRSPRELNEFRESQPRAEVPQRLIRYETLSREDKAVVNDYLTKAASEGVDPTEAKLVSQKLIRDLHKAAGTGKIVRREAGVDPLKNYELSPWYQEAAKKLGREPKLSDARYMMQMLFKEDATDPKGRPWFGTIQGKDVANRLGYGTRDQSELEMLFREALTPKAQDPFTGRWMDPLDLDKLMIKRRQQYQNEKLAKEKAKERKERVAKAEAEGKTIKKTGYKAKSNKKIYDKETKKSYTPAEWEKIKAQRAREANK